MFSFLPTSKQISKSALWLMMHWIYVTPQMANAQTADLSVVALFGDSITHGFNFSLPNRFTDMSGDGRTDRGCPTIYLRNILNKEADREGGNVLCQVVEGDSAVRDSNENQANAIVQNWGIGGTSTMNGILRINSDLQSAVAGLNPEQRFILIQYGTNDFNFGIPPSVTGANIEIMIDVARSNNFIPVVANLIPRTPGVNQGQIQNLAAYNSAISSAISNRNADSVDLNARFNAEPGGYQTLIESDELHPSDQGYLVIAETWFSNFLKQNISTVPFAQPAIIVPTIMLLLDEN